MYRWLSIFFMTFFFVTGCAVEQKYSTCDPPCDEDACRLCIEGKCVLKCTDEEVCDGQGNCVIPSDCDPPCDEDACELCVNGDCEYQCVGDEVCDGQGNCVTPSDCDPPCDENACELCVDSSCEYQCVGDEVCDGQGNCVTPSDCDPPCDEDACELCVDSNCEYQCVGDEVCDGEGNCVNPSDCDPPCDGEACEVCVEGDCVSYCEDYQGCDGAGTCMSKVGGPCVTDGDCLVTGGVCLDELGSGMPGGFCTVDCSIDDCPLGDECILVGDTYYLCAPACDTADDNCRDGLGCVDLGSVDICWSDCTGNSHCTTTDYCDIDSGFCECEPGYVPDFDTNQCVLFECPATEVFQSTSVPGNTCDEGTQLFDAGGTGVSCTDYQSIGHEVLFELSVPANTFVDISLLGMNYDASLWITTECDDFDGEHCVAGSDLTGENGLETVSIVNDTSNEVTYFIIADAYEGCGEYELTIDEFTPTISPEWTYVVDFEGTDETKTAYASDTVNLSGIDWNMTEALIGTLANDFKNGVRSARLRGYGISSMTMLGDKPSGLGVITFQYRRYGTDDQVPWKVEYSTDAGTSWTQIGAVFTAPANDVVQTFEETVNVTGSVRVRILRDTDDGNTTNTRLNIDDIKMSDFQ